MLFSLAAKSGEPLEEEKEAFDDAEKGKLAPSTEVTNVQVTKTPEKKLVEEETKPESEENKEEKGHYFQKVIVCGSSTRILISFHFYNFHNIVLFYLNINTSLLTFKFAKEKL